jgi:hypothetical protein
MIIMINIFITIKIAKPFIAFILYRFIENVKCTINSFDVSEGIFILKIVSFNADYVNSMSIVTQIGPLYIELACCELERCANEKPGKRTI